MGDQYKENVMGDQDKENVIICVYLYMRMHACTYVNIQIYCKYIATLTNILPA